MKYGLIGKKLSHSFSAEIHRQLFGYDYILTELTPQELESFMLRREFTAINVTIPYKEAVISCLDYVDETAREIGAVNTVVNRGGSLYGYNTDYAGLLSLIRHNGISVSDKNVLILGSGGTSKTALAVVKHLGCREAFRVSRTNAEDCISYSQAKEIGNDVEILINTTPCGMYPNIGESAVDIADFPALEGVVDVVYNPLRSKLVCDAVERGIPAVGGLYMLVAQAAAAAELFVSQTAPEEQIDAIYRSLLNAKQNVVLIGMPGCGKSTVGEALAKELDFNFVDIDSLIVNQDNRSISEIFAENGEQYFRNLEKMIIRRIAATQHSVIATGGGAVLDPDNIALLRENGFICFLDRSLDRLVTTTDRPLSSDRTALEQRYRERYSLYCDACDGHISANGTVDEVVAKIREEIAHDQA